MLLGFKPMFAEYVSEGSKTHTIRAHRKLSPKVGELCHCYTGLRQRGPIIQKLASGDVVRKKMSRLLGRFPLVRIQEIRIKLVQAGKHLALDIAIDGEPLSGDEAVALAWADGFRDGTRGTALQRMTQFWVEQHGVKAKDFLGQIIHWSYKKP